MNDLVEFYRARLDERAAKAQAAMRGGDGRWTQADPERYPGLIEDERRETVVYDEGSPREEQAAHIAENDPARVLREVEAKRDLILLYREATAAIGKGTVAVMAAAVVRRDALHRAVATLVSAWKDHPDYREEWRP